MNRHKSTDYWVGQAGEQVVSLWLQAKGWQICHRRWRCRGGEIDLIATEGEQLRFIEVKTRRSRNWDADGLLALTSIKQQRLWRAAETFLGKFPQYQDWPCRFDLALVAYPGAVAISLTPEQVPRQFVVRRYIEGILC
ncbi:MAG: YraN family protein [Cyanobacteria bacterium P01_G01_bin.54]